MNVLTPSRFAMFAAMTAVLVSAAGVRGDDLFRDKVAPIFETRCITCHNDETRKGGLSLQSAASLAKGSKHGAIVQPGDLDASKIIAMISGDKPKMPKEGGPLKPEQVEAIRAWVKAGAAFPADAKLEAHADLDWWSFQAIANPAPPVLDDAGQKWARNPIDQFVYARLRLNNLTPSPEADRRTLIRRLYFDLTGLPPAPDDVDAFVADTDPYAYEKLVDKLLASPRYGERWARHWLDIAHYGDTHGFDKDQVRDNAWPYRDYVIRSLNEDKPYDRFVKEQIAGDALYPDNPDGIIGLGFLAAGPWDLVGQIEVRDGTMEKQQVRNLDRDDMVMAISNTFFSLTAQCARCHDHKFDPIKQTDYYSLQAVIAAVDRADRPYDVSTEVATKRRDLESNRDKLAAESRRIEQAVNGRIKGELAKLEQRIKELESRADGQKRPEFGYHSAVVGSPNVEKWVQIDLGKPTKLSRIVLHPCHDDFAGIGAGFGFPVRYRVALSDDPTFADGVTVISNAEDKDQPNPGIMPIELAAGNIAARYVRVTATQLGERQKDFIFALAEVRAMSADGSTNEAQDKTVTSLDSIEAHPRWRRTNLVDGIYYTGGLSEGEQKALADANASRTAAFAKAAKPEELSRLEEIDASVKSLEAELAKLPKPSAMVYAAATDFTPRGSFHGTGGKPRPIYRLIRGSEKSPAKDEGEMTPSAVAELSAAHGLSHHFDLPADHPESARRAALAEWITDPKNPLTWRSIVNRVWQYHFGKGIVTTPNDFGRMGAQPTHPQLLDYLATRFRDGDRSIKSLHRLIVTSATYRQVSTGDAAKAKLDGSNQFLWRQNRLKLEAEPIRDATLAVAGKLNYEMGGPGFRVFGFKHDHSPHYKYQEYDPHDAATHRRAVYRFIVRSVPDPFMGSLDCADPSQIVARRDETLTALQALSLMNNEFMVVMAENFAARVEKAKPSVREQINEAYRIALGRVATDEELATLEPLAKEFGMANVCRLILNSNEFIFVD